MSFNAKAFVDYVYKNNPNEPEFLQAVTEVVYSLEDFISKNPKYSDQSLLERLVEPERILMFRVPWVDDKGYVHVNKGYRVQFNSAIGPYKGGLRFHPSVNLSILKFLGFEQTLKNSLTGLSLGGGKGGSDFDPSGKSDNEIMRFCQSFATELTRHINENTDVPAGDIGVGGREIGFIYGQYKRLKNEFTGVFTGKGLDYGGSLVRTEATGYGVIYLLNEVLESQNQELKGKKVLVSGSGNVSLYTVEKLLEYGAIPLTVSDSDGFILTKEGISREFLEELKELKFNRRGRLSELNGKFGSEYFASKNPWGVQADIAIPAATQNEILLDDMKLLKDNGIKIIIEAANMPTHIDAYNYIKDSNITFIPGKAANAGGVSVSGLEMAQNSQRLSWDFAQVDENLKAIMKNIHKTMHQYGNINGKVDYVTGANIGGFVKVANAMIAQGIV